MMKRIALHICCIVSMLATALGAKAISLSDFTYNREGFFEINTPEDMMNLSAYVNEGNTCRPFTFKVMVGELDFTGIKDFVPIGTDYRHYFAGTFDGQGVVIKNLSVTAENISAGLFGRTSQATVQNIIMDESCSITNKKYETGGIVGYQEGGTVANCVNKAKVSGEGSKTGGIVGFSTSTYSYLNDVEIKNCTNAGEVISAGKAGGIAGSVSGCTVSNSMNSGSISGQDYVGGIIGDRWSGSSIITCVNSGNVSGNNQVGGIVGQNWSGSLLRGCVVTGGNVTGLTCVGAIAGSHAVTLSRNYYYQAVKVIVGGKEYTGTTERGVGEKSQAPHDVKEMKAGSGMTYHNCAVLSTDEGNEETGDEEEELLQGMYNEATGCYEIGSVSDFNRFAIFVNVGNTCEGMTFVVTASELDFKDETDFAYVGMFHDNTITKFSGIFDGQGVLIKNLFIDQDEDEGMFSSDIGLFAQVNGTVKNIVMDESCHVAGRLSTGSFVGYLGDGGTVTGCHSSALVEGVQSIGGIVGKTGSNTTIDNCSFSGKVTGESILGGIAGYIYTGTVVVNCVNNGRVESTGKPEDAETDIKNGYKIDGSAVGGIVGKNISGKIRFCTNNGEISGPSFVGGIVGHNLPGVVQNCNNTAKLYASDNSVGGIAGFNQGASCFVIRCNNSGEIIAKNYSAGGIVGTNFGTIAECVNSGNVACGKKRAWESSKGEVYYVSRCGGICGYGSGNIYDCSVTKDVVIKGESANVGGILGDSEGANISGCIVEEASISGEKRIGGIVGGATRNTLIMECQNLSDVSGNLHIGGIAGCLVTNNDISTASASEMSEIRKCVNNGNIYSARAAAGGIAGMSHDIIRQSSSSGNVTAEVSGAGGIVGYASGTISDCIVTGGTVMSNKYLAGAIAGQVFRASKRSIFLSENYYVEAVTVKCATENYEKETPRGIGNGTDADDMSEYTDPDTGVTGYNCAMLKLDYEPPYVVTLDDFTQIADSTYAITSVDDMMNLASFVNSGNTCEGLMFLVTVTELDFAAVGNFEPIGHEGRRFAGMFNGQGVVIKNLKIEQEEFSCIGLFGYLTGQVSNVTLDSSCTISGGEYVGGIVGKCWGGSVINCSFGSDAAENPNMTKQRRREDGLSAATIVGNNYVGGIVGGNFFGSISDCLVKNITVSGESYVGAIIGNNSNGILSENYYEESVIVVVGENTYDGSTPRGLGAAADSQPTDVDEIIVDGETYFNGTALSVDTGIEVIPESNRQTEDDSWYDLSGRKLPHLSSLQGGAGGRLPKGIYIHRGKKIVVR